MSRINTTTQITKTWIAEDGRRYREAVTVETSPSPMIISDWNQVKGSMKEKALAHREKGTVYLQHGMYLGCM